VDKFWRMDVVDRAILDEVRKLLTPASIDRIVERALATLRARPAATDGQKIAIRKELQEVEAEIQNLTQAVALGRRSVPELVTLLQARDRRRSELQGQLAALEGHVEPRLGLAGPELRRRLEEWVGF
jgi:chromosome segregation ATPase